MANPVVAALGELVGEVTGVITERAISWQLAALAQGMFVDEVFSLLEGALRQPRFPGENYVTPVSGLENIAKLLSFAAKLSVISPELGETITEGISEDLMTALQHVTTEPLERAFSVLFGAENIDSDDLTEAYAWGMLRPEMLAWLLAVDGVSNSAAAAAATKALGEKYSGDFKAVEDAAAAAAAKMWIIALDPLDKIYSEARSALFGVPEAARTAFNEFVAEVLRLYTGALRRALEALAYMRAAETVGDAKLQQAYLVRAEQKYAEAEGFLEAARSLAGYLERFEAALAPVLDDLVASAVSLYERAAARAADGLKEWLEEAARLAAGVQAEMVEEYEAFRKALRDIRAGAEPPAAETPPGSTRRPGAPGFEVVWVG